MKPADLDPVFREPWEAHAFAMVLELQARGVFTPKEWMHALSTQIASAQNSGDRSAAEGIPRSATGAARGDPDPGDTYYQHWLAALEAIVAMKGITSPDELQHFQSAWDRAAGRTPHGQTIELQPGDFSDHR
jgi:hypothetical protein